MEKIYDKLITKLSKDNIYINENMSKHTSIKIGGPADIFIKVKTIEELKHILEISKQENIPITIVGNGTNLLVRDKGIRGVVVQLKFEEIKVNGTEIEAGAGAKLALLAKAALDNSLVGLEFASGIPGTIGGAIVMNAGAYGAEFKDIVVETTYIDHNLEVHTISNKEHKFEYRSSIFKGTDFVILGTKLKLLNGDRNIIKNKLDEYSSKRRSSQPLEYPNAGSIFKRGNGFVTAEIVDKCGLKGYNIGDAYISEKHAGFIINKGKATANDVLTLIEHIRKTVYEKYNFEIETEIKIIGE